MANTDTAAPPVKAAPIGGPATEARPPRKRPRIALWIGITVLTVFSLYPVWWILTSALTPQNELLGSSPKYYPTSVTFDNFRQLSEQFPVGTALMNSIILSVVSSVLAIAISYLAAYAFARYTFPASNLIFVALLLSASLPQIATVIPLFQLFGDLSLIDTLQGLVLLITSMLTPFTVWILTTFIKRVPVEIEEAARVDGAGFFRIITRVTGPLTMPAIGTMFVINFVISWHEVFFPLIFAQTSRSQPMALGLLNLSGSVANAGRPWHLIAALTILMIGPVIAVVAAFEPMITKGLAVGSDK